MKRSSALITGLALLAMTGCAGTGGLGAQGSQGTRDPAPLAHGDTEVVASHLEVINRLGSGTPEERAGIVESVRRDYEQSPGPSRQLLYACVLATPGHVASDLGGARILLDRLLAEPELLGPTERSLAQIMDRQVSSSLAMERELRELRTAAEDRDLERSADAEQRIEAQAAENARLRKELNEALAKLEAIAELERSLVSRPASKGERP